MIGPAPDLPSRFRVMCNNCQVFIIDDRKDKVHDKWNHRNFLQIGSEVIYLQPPVTNPFYPVSSVKPAFDLLAKKLAEFKPPADNDPDAWQQASEQMHDILLAMKNLDRQTHQRARETKHAKRKNE